MTRHQQPARYHADMYEVTLFPIIGAGIFSMILAFVWYHPKVFGGVWLRLTKAPSASVESGKRKIPMKALVGVIGSMIAAYMLNYLGVRLGIQDIPSAIELGFWCAIGFVVPTMLSMVLWEQKAFLLYVINAGYWVLSFMGMAAILVI